MKANQKFIRGDDAVSPVIAVILMVAITVVLAATVYVWVSGFGSNTNSAPAHTMSLASAGAVSNAALVAGNDGPDNTANTADDVAANPAHYYKSYTVSSADPSLTYGDLAITVAGEAFTLDGANCGHAALADAEWGACRGAAPQGINSLVKAGDTITLRCDASSDCLSDADLLFLDKEANSVMVTLKIR